MAPGAIGVKGPTDKSRVQQMNNSADHQGFEPATHTGPSEA